MGHESFRTENGASFSQICDKEMLRKHDHQRNGQFDNLTSEIISSERKPMKTHAGFRYSPGPTLKYDSKSGVKLPVLETLLPFLTK